jgi:hypothetical protein
MGASTTRNCGRRVASDRSRRGSATATATAADEEDTDLDTDLDADEAFREGVRGPWRAAGVDARGAGRGLRRVESDALLMRLPPRGASRWLGAVRSRRED